MARQRMARMVAKSVALVVMASLSGAAKISMSIK